jgi:hypothetical protein
LSLPAAPRPCCASALLLAGRTRYQMRWLISGVVSGGPPSPGAATLVLVAGGVACGCALLGEGLIAGTRQRQQAPDRLLLEAAAAGNVIAVRGLLSTVPKLHMSRQHRMGAVKVRLPAASGSERNGSCTAALGRGGGRADGGDVAASATAALLAAVQGGRGEVVELLLEWGVDPDSRWGPVVGGGDEDEAGQLVAFHGACSHG